MLLPDLQSRQSLPQSPVGLVKGLDLIMVDPTEVPPSPKVMVLYFLGAVVPARALVTRVVRVPSGLAWTMRVLL